MRQNADSSAGPPETGSGAASSPAGGITTDDLMRALASAGAMPDHAPTVPLQDVVTADEVTEDGVLNDQAAQEQLLPTYVLFTTA